MIIFNKKGIEMAIKKTEDIIEKLSSYDRNRLTNLENKLTVAGGEG